MMPSETDKAYAAGLLDADGSLGVYSTGTGYTKSQVVVAGQSNEMLIWLRDTWGGRIEHGGGKMRINKWIAGTTAVRITFLTDVLPYLRVKRDIAELVLDYLSNQWNKSEDEFLEQTKDLNWKLSRDFVPWVKELSTDKQGGE
jgi:hypothetical protein